MKKNKKFPMTKYSATSNLLIFKYGPHITMKESILVSSVCWNVSTKKHRERRGGRFWDWCRLLSCHVEEIGPGMQKKKQKMLGCFVDGVQVVQHFYFNKS